MLYTEGHPISQLGTGFAMIGSGSWIGIPVPVWIAILVVLAAHQLTKLTRTGRYIYAIGGNEEAARLSGIDIGVVKRKVYVMAGSLAALGGLIVTARLDSAQPNAGTGYELDAIAAVVIGGTSLSGGRGSVAGTVMGAVIIGVLNNGLVLLNVSPFWQQVVKGVGHPAGCHCRQDGQPTQRLKDQMKNKYILAIDQGTSSTKTLIFDQEGKVLAQGVESLDTRYLAGGFVEQDARGIWENVRTSASRCLWDLKSKRLDPADIAAIGISNQRETFVVWDAEGRPLSPAVVWQCKRSVSICQDLRDAGLEDMVRARTGLIIDPYFSATKLIWLKDHVEAVSIAMNAGEAYFGTVDSWLLHCMTDGREYITDHTNASRTLMFDIHRLQWDEELIGTFGLKGIRLPEVRPGAGHFGETDLGGLLPFRVPVTGMLGDSHAAAFGEGCFSAGEVKATLGTGCSMMMNIGEQPRPSKNGMVTTICWSTQEKVCYAFEGMIVSCGSTLEWVREKLGFFEDSGQTEAMAHAVSDNGGVVLVPAFNGLGSPHWQADRRASITGIGFDTTKEHIVRAALESIPYQIRDVIDAMASDAGIIPDMLKVDGGITANAFVMQFLADLQEYPVDTIGMPDVSAMGAAFMAGLGAGIFSDLSEFDRMSVINIRYEPREDKAVKDGYVRWRTAIVP